MYNNFNAYNTFRQAYDIYTSAVQYVVARETYINQTINKMEIEVKKRLQNLDKILTDYYQLYEEIQKEAAVHANHRIVQEYKIARVQEEVKRLKMLLENKNTQDAKITKLEQEIKNLKIFKKIDQNQNQVAEQIKAQSKEKTSFSTQIESINNDYDCTINSNQEYDNIIIKELSKAENTNKLLTESEKINDSDTDNLTNFKEQTKHVYVNMNIFCKNEEKSEDNVQVLTIFSKQSKKIADSKSSSENNNKNLVATKGKNWNNHNINAWLEQKLNVSAKKVWKVIVFGEYKHIEFDAIEYKEFVWRNREKWEEEGVWLWFEC